MVTADEGLACVISIIALTSSPETLPAGTLGPTRPTR
jgi:hypothetical protein